MVSASRAKLDVWTFLTLLLLFSSVYHALVFLVADAPKQWAATSCRSCGARGWRLSSPRSCGTEAYAVSGGDGDELATS